MAKMGIEVEGRFKGLRTFFLTADEFNNLLGSSKWPSIGLYQQLYISDHENILDLAKHENLLHQAKCVVVTVERTKVPLMVDASINIILYVKNDSFWNLKPTDQVKFERDLFVSTMTLENMSITEPWEFENDEEL